LADVVRTAAFFVPGALGVQEASYLVLGRLLGVPPDAALALSLIGRARELIFGVPGLLAWRARSAAAALSRRGARIATEAERCVPRTCPGGRCEWRSGWVREWPSVPPGRSCDSTRVAWSAQPVAGRVRTRSRTRRFSRACTAWWTRWRARRIST